MAGNDNQNRNKNKNKNKREQNTCVFVQQFAAFAVETEREGPCHRAGPSSLRSITRPSLVKGAVCVCVRVCVCACVCVCVHQLLAQLLPDAL